MEDLPFLFFPDAVQKSSHVNGVPIDSPNFPGKNDQIARISNKIKAVERAFKKIAYLSTKTNLGMEPETVLIMEIAGSIQDFKRALERVGFEWLAEWDEDEYEPDDYFHCVNKNNERTTKKVASKLFVSMANRSAMQQLLSLWNKWRTNENFDYGTNKWKNLFSQLINIRTWGPEESFYQTGMAERWQDLVDPIKPNELIKFQIDFFYRSDIKQRQQLVKQISKLLKDLGGAVLNTLDIDAIRFHAVKAELPAYTIKELLDELKGNALENKISLLNFPGIMYLKPTGQSLSIGEVSESQEIPTEINYEAIQEPIAVLLDGLPLTNHRVLNKYLIVDDLFELEQHYQAGEQLHGTTMASLAINGDLNETKPTSTKNTLICIPIMQPDPSFRSNKIVHEYVPEDEFIERRVLEAIKHINDQKHKSAEDYKQVCIINFSIGVADQIFHSTLSPLARLIDWLSYTYNLLFFISAGNYLEPIKLGMPYAQWHRLSKNEKIKQIFQKIEDNKQSKRILSPAESFNSLTIGGYHADESGLYTEANRLDPLNDLPFPSLISRIGHGFNNAIKPEIYLPAGRQLYHTPHSPSAKTLSLNKAPSSPGNKVALPSSTQKGNVNMVGYTRGTSNATALATHNAQIIYNHLNDLANLGHKKIPNQFMPVVIKALLTHAAKQPDEVKKLLVDIVDNKSGKSLNRTEIARYLGYGYVDLEWLLRNTQQRATVIGWSEIGSKQEHEYHLPLPVDLSNRNDWRRIVITLAWLSPINSNHSNLREAKLEVQPVKTWGSSPLNLERTEQNNHRVKKGTIQHEILENDTQIAVYQDGETLALKVTCRPDATSHLDEKITYCLAVTLEVKEETNLLIYQQIQQQVQQTTAVRTKV